jgi:predicted acyl esterase
MVSGSYVGATQMLAAISRPPHLAGICPVVTASNYHENWAYRGRSAFEQWFDESWTAGAGPGHLQPDAIQQKPRMRW